MTRRAVLFFIPSALIYCKARDEYRRKRLAWLLKTVEGRAYLNKAVYNFDNACRTRKA